MNSAAAQVAPWRRQVHEWLYEGYNESEGSQPHAAHTTAWWKVMCLTGVDYFSTLAYQPSIAFLAAGALSPIATLVLVLLTLFGALPMYSRVAAMSPHGQGSILILEELFPRWKGKVIVLCLLGFAATDFVITITLSAADASAHLIQNPLTPLWLDHPMVVTLLLLLTLGAIFLRGFREAIALAVGLVGIYLALNAIVVLNGLQEILRHPHLVMEWKGTLFARHGDPVMMGAMAIILFPKLALGLSGFETGVGVSRARASRQRLRHAVRRQHDRDSLVRRRLRDGRPAESDPAVPAALRHGAGVGAREPPARAHHHGDHRRRDDHLQGQRRRAG